MLFHQNKNPYGVRVSEWSRRPELNRRPIVYETIALPAELRRRCSRRSFHGWLAVALLLLLAAPVRALADQQPTYFGKPDAAETAWASQMSAYLMAHYPTVADGEKAGYVRYTSADETGAISYANKQWESKDYEHPSQLWYDKNGKLLGADYSVLTSTSPSRPNLWGINPGRWFQFNAHVHWAQRDPATGQVKYDLWAWDSDFNSVQGADANNPSPNTIVAMKKVQNASDVVTIFHFPSLWDLIVWVVPNPTGAFAWHNPNVKP